MKNKRIPLLLGATLALLLTMSAVGCQKTDSHSSTDTNDSSLSETVTQEEIPTREPDTEVPTMQETQAPETEPAQTLPDQPEIPGPSAEDAAIIKVLQAAMEKMEQKTQFRQDMTTLIHVVSPGEDAFTFTSEVQVTRDGDRFSMVVSSDAIDSGAIVYILHDNILYVSGLTEVPMKAPVEAEQLTTIKEMLFSDAMEYGVDVSSLRDLKLETSGATTIITFHSMDMSDLIDTDLIGGMDMSDKGLTVSGRYELVDGLPSGIIISTSMSMEIEGQAMTMQNEMRISFQYENITVQAPSDADTYQLCELDDILDGILPGEEEDTLTMYVTADVLRMRSTPDFSADNNIIGYLKRGDVVQVLLLTDDYAIIAFDDDQIAYVGINYLSELPPEQ